MSNRVTRVTDQDRVQRFTYGARDGFSPEGLVSPPSRPRPVQVLQTGSALRSTMVGTKPDGAGGTSVPSSSASLGSGEVDSVAALQEREAFAQGYAQGERAGLDLATRQLSSLRERLGRTLEELAALREDLTYRTERQVVDLALAVASRILHREVSLDRELLLVMARIALERLGDVTIATIRLHPEDEAAARGDRESWEGGSVTIVADASVRPGACLVQTAQGVIEVGVDAQLKELATALLGDTPVPPAMGQPRE